MEVFKRYNPTLIKCTEYIEAKWILEDYKKRMKCKHDNVLCDCEAHNADKPDSCPHWISDCACGIDADRIPEKDCQGCPQNPSNENAMFCPALHTRILKVNCLPECANYKDCPKSDAPKENAIEGAGQ